MTEDHPGPGADDGGARQQRTRPGRRLMAAAVGVSLAIAACTSSSDDAERPNATDADRNETVTSAEPVPPPGTSAMEETTTTDIPVEPESPTGDPSDVAATEAPDASGLPSLAELDPDTRTGTLDNGLRYFIRENDNPGSKAEMRLVIDAGSGLENEVQVGGAHFLEHMLFNGTERFPENELIDLLRSFGAGFGPDVNAYTSFDETVYQLTVPSTDQSIVDTGLDVLEEWLTSATIGADAVIAERGIVLDEWRVGDETAGGRLADEIVDFFLAGSAYDGHSPIGGSEAISNTEADALREFYDDWYRPDNAAVIVVGDIDVDRVEQAIIDRFGPATARGDSPERVDLPVTPSDETVARVASDADLAEGYAFVTLPLSAEAGASFEADAQREIYERMAFTIVATRLNNDALRGEAPFDSADVDSSGFVRGLVAPEIYITVDGPDVEASIQAITDEYERVRRYGFSEAELARAGNDILSAAESTYDGRQSRQDASFADEYVDHVLGSEPYVDAQREFDFITEVVTRATVGNLGHVFVERLDAAGKHIFVAVPDDELDATPSADELVALADGAATRAIAQREQDAAIGDELIARPTPVSEIETDALGDESFPGFIDPTVLTFPNGVRVAFNTNEIVEGTVFFEARSPGGLAVVADESVPDADAVGDVVGASGVGAFDRVAIDAFLDDKEVSVSTYIDQFEEGMFGTGATSDLEVLFQMIHLTMTQPRVDPVALDQYLDDELPYAENPSLDSGYAEVVAQRDARYDDVRFLAPTVETLATVDVDGIAEVMADRFGDAGDFTFSFSGDFSINEATELARAYLGTLPATDRVEDPGFTEPPPPPGPIVVETQAGEGEQATVSFLFTASATTDRRDDVLASVVQEVVTNRLTDFIREELGSSYSPFGVLQLGGGDSPQTELYISVSTGPDLVDEVSDAVLGQLDDLRTNGPTDREFTNATAAVGEALNFFNNGQVNDAVLDVLVDPEGSADFDDFLFEFELLPGITRQDVQAAIGQWAPASDYIEIRVLPRR